MKARELLLKTVVFYLLFYICRFSFFSIMPIVAEELGLTHMSLAWISSILFVGYAVMLIPSGFLADKYNPVNVLLTGSIISSSSNMLMALAASEDWLKILMFINGIGQGMGWAPLIKLLTVKMDKAKIGLAIGFLMSSAVIGPSIAYTVASIIAYISNWKMSLIIPALVLLAYSTTFRRMKTVSESTELSLNCIKNANAWLIGFSYLFFYAVYRGFLVWMPTFLYEKTGLYLFSSIYSSILSATGALSGYIGYYLSLKLYKGKMKKIIAYSMLAAILPCLALSYEGNNIYLLTWLFAFYFLLSLPLWLFFIYPPKIFPMKVVGTITGFIDSLGYLGNFTGTLILGLAYSVSTTGRELFYLMAVLLLAGSTFSLFIRE